MALYGFKQKKNLSMRRSGSCGVQASRTVRDKREEGAVQGFIRPSRAWFSFRAWTKSAYVGAMTKKAGQAQEGLAPPAGMPNQNL